MRNGAVLKILGIFFILFGLFWVVMGVANYASDIQLGIALSGVCMSGIGGVLVALAGIKSDLLNLWLWVKKMDENRE